MRPWGWEYWPAFLTISSIGFVIPELAGLFTNSVNTLSDYCWHELGVNVTFGHGQHTVAWWCSLVAWVLFFVVITLHIWWRSV